jgi:hypothetical protein
LSGIPYADYIYKSYQKDCSPGETAFIEDVIESSITIGYFCCNNLNCNENLLPEGVAIGCYACDSRVTGLAGCSILNESSPYVYTSSSSNSAEACAVSSSKNNPCSNLKDNLSKTIVGLAGRDAISN